MFDVGYTEFARFACIKLSIGAEQPSYLFHELAQSCQKYVHKHGRKLADAVACRDPIAATPRFQAQ